MRQAKEAVRIPVRDLQTFKILRKPGIVEIICENDLAAFSKVLDWLALLVQNYLLS